MDEARDLKFPRRSLLRSFVIASSGAELIRVTPVSAQTHDHAAPAWEPDSGAGKTPRYFSGSQYLSLRTLCQLVIPSEEAGESPRPVASGGAIEAEVPAFIDLLTSENKDYQRRLSGGLAWLDAFCTKRFDRSFVECTAAQQTETLDTIAYRGNAQEDPSVLPGVEFFAFVRDLVLDGFFTSKIGIHYLDYEGNRVIQHFAGCPEIKD